MTPHLDPRLKPMKHKRHHSINSIVFLILSLYAQLAWSDGDLSVVSAYTLEWHDGAPPDEVVKSPDFKEWLGGTLVENNSQLRYAKTSLTASGSSEIIVQERVGGSGGYSFIALTKDKKSWRELAAFQGGFIFWAVPSLKHQLYVYHRSGSNYSRTEGDFNGKTYSFVTAPLPHDLTHFDVGSLDFYNFFWSLCEGKKTTFPKDHAY